MKCPFITGKYILSCTANEKAEVYIPSLFELKEYCETNHHTRCPLKNQNTPLQENVFVSGRELALRW